MRRLKNIVFWQRTIGLILLLYCLFRIGMVNYIDYTLEKIIVNNAEKGISLSYEDINVGWVFSSVSIYNLKFIGKNSQDSVFRVDVGHARINKLKVMELLISKRLKILNLDFIHVTVSTWAGRHLPQSEEAGIRMNKLFRRLKVDKILFKELVWRYLDENGKLEALVETERLSLDGLRLKQRDKGIPTMSLESLRNSDLNLEFPGNKHRYLIGNIVYNHIDSSLIINNIHIIPLLDKVAFSNYYKSQQDRISGMSREIKFSGFSILDTMGVHVHSRSMDLTFELEVYRNKRYPFTRKRTVLLPSEMFKRVGFLFDVDSVRLRDGFVAYEELNIKDRNPGRVFFQDIDMDAFHFTNDSTQADNVFYATGNFMGQGRVKAEITMPLGYGKDYRIKGACSSFELKEVNSILKSTYLVDIKSGILDTMAFDFTYNIRKSQGIVDFKYSDLKVHVYNAKDTDKKSFLKSWAMNQFIRINKIGDANLTGKINFERNPSRSVFYYWSKSLLYGLKDALIKNGAINPKFNKSKTFILDDG
ncbi:MAG: DUF748 domain-containing protein [Saprospiraceae bacterium]|nr:DUF748 domain-containing protein [Saprospiraceae bacterium]